MDTAMADEFPHGQTVPAPSGATDGAGPGPAMASRSRPKHAVSARGARQGITPRFEGGRPLISAFRLAARW